MPLPAEFLLVDDYYGRYIAVENPQAHYVIHADMMDVDVLWVFPRWRNNPMKRVGTQWIPRRLAKPLLAL